MSIKEEVQKFEITLQEKSAALSTALPRGVDAPRYMRMLVNAVIKNPKLLEYDRPSLLVSMMNAAETGLEADPALGQVYFVPRKGKVACQIGYKGFIQLAYRSDKIASIDAGCARDGDDFSFELGSDPTIKHRMGTKRGEPTHVWAVVRTKDGGRMCDVMLAGEVNAIRDRCSDSAKSGFSPWKSDWEAMAKKTVLRRLLKLAPISTELGRAIGLDEEAEILTPEDCKGAKDIVSAALPKVEVGDAIDLDFDASQIPDE